MPTIHLKNNSKVVVHGKRPGAVFEVEVDEDGLVLDLMWRRRLQDEANFGGDHILVVNADGTPIADETPVPASPQPAPKKAKAPSLVTPAAAPSPDAQKD